MGLEFCQGEVCRTGSSRGRTREQIVNGVVGCVDMHMKRSIEALVLSDKNERPNPSVDGTNVWTSCLPQVMTQLCFAEQTLSASPWWI